MTPEEEAQVLADAEAHGLTFVQGADGKWRAEGDTIPAPSFADRSWALSWLSNRLLAIELAKRQAHPSSGLASRYGPPGGEGPLSQDSLRKRSPRIGR